MTPARLFAVVVIFCGSAFAWSILGGTLVSRTGESDARLAQEVAQLWGGRHNQIAPSASIERPRVVVEDIKDNAGHKTGETRKTVLDEVPVALESSRVDVSLTLDQRRRACSGTTPTASTSRHGTRCATPTTSRGASWSGWLSLRRRRIYDGFTFKVNGASADRVSDLAQGVPAETTLAPRRAGAVELAYRSRGLGDWSYSFVAERCRAGERLHADRRHRLRRRRLPGRDHVADQEGAGRQRLAADLALRQPGRRSADRRRCAEPSQSRTAGGADHLLCARGRCSSSSR